jgi:transposase
MKSWVVEAYEMYIQGFSYPMISEHLGENQSTIRHYIKRYAYQNSLVYPRLNPNYELAFNLHYNSMSVKDIALYMGVCQSTIRNYIRRFSERNGVINGSYKKCQVAYSLRCMGYTYEKIAKMLDYHDRSNCYRAIKKYEESLS